MLSGVCGEAVWRVRGVWGIWGGFLEGVVRLSG